MLSNLMKHSFTCASPIDLNKLVFLHLICRNESIVSIEAVSYYSAHVFRVQVQQLHLDNSLEIESDHAESLVRSNACKGVGLRVALHQFVHFITTLDESDIILCCYNARFKKRHCRVLAASLRSVGLWDQFGPKLVGNISINELIKSLQPNRKHFKLEVVYKALLGKSMDTNQTVLVLRDLFQNWVVPTAAKKNIPLNLRTIRSIDLF